MAIGQDPIDSAVCARAEVSRLSARPHAAAIPSRDSSSPSGSPVVGPPPDAANVIHLDPYSDEVLSHPEAYASQWLDAGPAFWIAPIGTWGIARYAEMTAALRDWETYCSGGGNGIVNRFTDATWRTPSALLDADPPEHTQNRSILAKVFAPAALKPRFDRLAVEADALIERLVAHGSFDAATDLATDYAHGIVPVEIGLKRHRPDLLFAYGLAGGNSQFPFNARYWESASDPQVAEAVAWVDESCERDNLTPDGWGAAIHAAADDGQCSRAMAKLIVRSMITAGVENTVLAIGNMVHAFAAHPDEWQKLRANPELARAAIDEVMRWAGPTHQYFRTTTRDTQVGEVIISSGSKVLILQATANRDPRRWEDPDRFDIGRRTTGQLGFGFGPHQCAGQAMARQQMTVVLNALVERVEELTFAKEPVLRLNNTARGFASIPVKVTRATNRH